MTPLNQAPKPALPAEPKTDLTPQQPRKDSPTESSEGSPEEASPQAAEDVSNAAPTARSRSDLELGFATIARALAAHARSRAGKLAALQPPWLSDDAQVRTALQRVEEAQALGAAGIALPWGPPQDIDGALEEVRRGGQLTGAQLVQVAVVAESAVAWHAFGEQEKDTWPALAQMASSSGRGSAQLGPMAQTLRGALLADGSLRDDASPLLRQLRDQVRGLDQRIRSFMEDALQDVETAPHLQDGYVTVRNGRYVLPVVASFQSKVPGIVHNASQTGQTLFIEPLTILHWGNALVVLRAQLADEERRLLALLSQEVEACRGTLVAAVASLVGLDVVLASAELAQQCSLRVPTLTAASGPLVLRALRHPALVLQGARVVQNDVVLDGKVRALIISGPNAGGKTVTLRAIGLCARMLRAGLPVPVGAHSSMPLFDGLFANVGDAQDIARGHSSFSAHVSALKEAATAATAGTLVLLDEIGKDTDPSEGAALARAVLEHLLKQGALVVATTHLEAVKTLAHVDARFANARMALNEATLQPTYRLETGVAGRSHAFAVARRIGMPEGIVARAGELLEGGEGSLTAALEQLEAEHRRWAEQGAQLARERVGLLEKRATLEREGAQLAAQAENARQQAAVRLAQTLEQSAASLTKRLAELARPDGPSGAALAEAHKQRADWHREAARSRAGAGARMGANDGKVGETPALAAAGTALQVGAAVWITTLARAGEIVALEQDQAVCALGNMRTRVPVAVLRPLAASHAARRAPTKAVTRVVAAQAPAEPTSVSMATGRCDLRGLHWEQASGLLTRALDACLSNGTGQLWVIHGHGTGILRNRVREALSASPYVAQHRAGEEHEGGDGVTVVLFDVPAS